MKLHCPSCNEAFDLNLSSVQSPHETVCDQCQIHIRVCWKFHVETIGPSSQGIRRNASVNPSPISGNRGGMESPTVLLAIDGDATRGAVREILVKGGLSVLEATNGREALDLLQKSPPAVTLLDVELPQVLGFQVCEVIKKSPLLKNIAVILVASIYDKTRYKREPKNLYGADDYIERHQINDELLGKIKRLLNRQGIHWAGDPTGIQPSSRETSQDMPSDNLQGNDLKTKDPGPGGDPMPSLEPFSTENGGEVTITETSRNAMPSTEGPQGYRKPDTSAQKELSPQHTDAQRLARIIISDIALYNQKNVEEGLRKGNFTELLKSEIDEGRKLYQERVADEIQHSTNYFDEAIREFISKRTQTVK